MMYRTLALAAVVLAVAAFVAAPAMAEKAAKGEGSHEGTVVKAADGISRSSDQVADDPRPGREVPDRVHVEDPAARCEELSRLSGYERLRELGVPGDELREVAEATAVRTGAMANPRPASPEAILELSVR